MYETVNGVHMISISIQRFFPFFSLIEVAHLIKILVKPFHYSILGRQRRSTNCVLYAVHVVVALAQIHTHSHSTHSQCPILRRNRTKRREKKSNKVIQEPYCFNRCCVALTHRSIQRSPNILTHRKNICTKRKKRNTETQMQFHNLMLFFSSLFLFFFWLGSFPAQLLHNETNYI